MRRIRRERSGKYEQLGIGDSQPVISLEQVSAYYGGLQAIRDISLSVYLGDILCIVGANGAGKSTLLNSIVGLMADDPNCQIDGSIRIGKVDVTRAAPHAIVELGVSLAPEGRQLFGSMSVEENLLVGAYPPRVRSRSSELLAGVYELFPNLADRRSQIVSKMSGGEQQMVAIGRALMSDPSILLIDEMSLGLAPIVVADIADRVREIHRRGTTFLLVEQEIGRAFDLATRICVMLEGTVVMQGTPESLDRDLVIDAYFGVNDAGS